MNYKCDGFINQGVLFYANDNTVRSIDKFDSMSIKLQNELCDFLKLDDEYKILPNDYVIELQLNNLYCGKEKISDVSWNNDEIPLWVVPPHIRAYYENDGFNFMGMIPMRCIPEDTEELVFNLFDNKIKIIFDGPVYTDKFKNLYNTIKYYGIN